MARGFDYEKSLADTDAWLGSGVWGLLEGFGFRSCKDSAWRVDGGTELQETYRLWTAEVIGYSMATSSIGWLELEMMIGTWKIALRFTGLDTER